MKYRWIGSLLCMSAWAVAGGDPVAAEADRAAAEFFESKVRPLLSGRCYECHTGAMPKGGLRLDSRASALAGGDTGTAIVPGDPDASLLVDAIRYGETYQMPPEGRMSDDEIAVLVEWIRRGAVWPEAATAAEQAPSVEAFDFAERAKHWSFRPLAETAPPEVRREGWARTAIDRFVRARLEQANLEPAPEADRYTLLRRVTFDLTGLPPTREEIAAFAADDSPQAYEKVVTRLLASPHYGERMARQWLDLARYAETHGHEFDYEIPNAWRYRDYLVRAFNDDLPYDQFVLEHLAGDLLEPPRMHATDATNESIVATGFWWFGEAKHSPVDTLQDEADRIDNQIDVFGKTFLGLTIACARCHDHKFDPIRTVDYYALAGYLQSSRYQQAYLDSPEVFAPSLGKLCELREKEQAAVQGVAALARDHAETIATSAAVVERWRSQAPEISPSDDASDATKECLELADFSAGYGECKATGQAFADRPARPGDLASSMEADRMVAHVAVAPAAHSGRLGSRLRGTLRSPTFEITSPKIVYRLYGTGGHVRLILNGLQLIMDPIYGGLDFKPARATPYWHVQDTSKWLGQRAYLELVDDGDGWLAVERVALAPGDWQPPAAGTTPNLAEALASRSPEAIAWLARDWTLHRGDYPAWPQNEDWSRWTAERQALETALPTPRQAPAFADGTGENQRVYVRGNPKTPREEAPRRNLEVLSGLTPPAPAAGSGRLEWARQLISQDNPLLPRVLVNRIWKQHFGVGLVATPDDFGHMGQPPSHPELLDYLAREFQREGWSIKRMHREIVLSAAYRMSSRTSADDERDPANRLLHRANLRRLDAESLRDAMLAISGRLDPAMGGPGVAPYLTDFMVGRGRPAESGPLDGAGRRSLYLAVRRNFLPPLFTAFDYPTPSTTVGRRGESYVPAQALALLNHPLVAQLARLWAERTAGAATPRERIQGMYLDAFGRPPTEAEVEAAEAFVSGRGEEAWSELGHVLMNVKEFIHVG